jgi:hypothetical protein
LHRHLFLFLVAALSAASAGPDAAIAKYRMGTLGGRTADHH